MNEKYLKIENTLNKILIGLNLIQFVVGSSAKISQEYKIYREEKPLWHCETIIDLNEYKQKIHFNYLLEDSTFVNKNYKK